jgi:hypothetical protein
MGSNISNLKIKFMLLHTVCFPFKEFDIYEKLMFSPSHLRSPSVLPAVET